MDFNLFTACIDEIADYSGVAVVPFFRGESLLHPRFLEMIRYAKMHRVGPIQLATNGLLLSDDMARYTLGSVLNHVLLHQTIIGLETQKQFEMADDYPDIMFSCLGGGSNFGGFTLPFIGDRLKKGKDIKFVAAQSEVAPNMTGEYRYDFGDHAGLTPLIKMCSLGHETRMEPIFGDGLRYHGASPILSLLRNEGYIDTVAYPQDEKHVFERTRLFMRSEGFLPAPESSYGICAMIDEALRCKETGEEKVLAVNISGHGFMDMFGFDKVLQLTN